MRFLLVIMPLLIFSCTGQHDEPLLSQETYSFINSVQEMFEAEEVKYSYIDSDTLEKEKTLSVEFYSSKFKFSSDEIKPYSDGVFSGIVETMSEESRLGMHYIIIRFRNDKGFKGTPNAVNILSFGYDTTDIRRVARDVTDSAYVLKKQVKNYIENKDGYNLMLLGNLLIENRPRNNFGWKLKGTGELFWLDTASAIQSFKKALEIDNRDHESAMNLASVYVARGRFDSALIYTDTVFYMNYRSPKGYYYRGLCHYYLNHDYDYCEDLLKAFRLGYRELEKHGMLGCDNRGN